VFSLVRQGKDTDDSALDIRVAPTNQTKLMDIASVQLDSAHSAEWCTWT